LRRAGLAHEIVAESRRPRCIPERFNVTAIELQPDSVLGMVFVRIVLMLYIDDPV
jgi:hypothetical protein